MIVMAVKLISAYRRRRKRKVIVSENATGEIKPNDFDYSDTLN